MKVKVCMGSNCVMMGNMSILSQLEGLQESIQDLEFEIETVKCLGVCKQDDQACPVVQIDEEIVTRATSQEVMERITKDWNK